MEEEVETELVAPSEPGVRDVLRPRFLVFVLVLVASRSSGIGTKMFDLMMDSVSSVERETSDEFLLERRKLPELDILMCAMLFARC